jgi:hypothetical protein
MRSLVLSCGMLFFVINAQGNELPYRLWWSFPDDDVSTIEIDDADLHLSRFQSRWQVVLLLRRCDLKKSRRLAERRDETPVRELKVEALSGEGETRTTMRCVLPLKGWRTQLGPEMVERLEDELDAHLRFLLPRKLPTKTDPSTDSPGSSP